MPGLEPGITKRSRFIKGNHARKDYTMRGHHYRYNPPTPYRPWGFVGYYAFHPITGVLRCLSYYLMEPDSREDDSIPRQL